MTHYEALGVATDAPADEIRRAYLRLARVHHPDRHAAGGAAPTAAERRMQDINAAWAVLSDPVRRTEYDRRVLRLDATDVAFPRPAGPTIQQPSRDFHPYFANDEDDDDSWRYEPDVGNPATNPGRLLTLAPPILVLVGITSIAVWAVVGVRALVAVGVMCLFVAVLLFFAAPMVAMFKGQMYENRPVGSKPPKRPRSRRR